MAVRVVRSVGRRIPRVGADRLERLVRQVGDSVVQLARDRASPQTSAAVGRSQLALRRGLAVVLRDRLRSFRRSRSSSSPPTASPTCSAPSPSPRGVSGVIEASAATLLVSFGVTRNVATLAVLGWRLVNFWLPIPDRRRGLHLAAESPGVRASGPNAKRWSTWPLKRSDQARSPMPDPTSEEAIAVRNVPTRRNVVAVGRRPDRGTPAGSGARP